MHSFVYRAFNTGPPLNRKPVWILLTALAFAVVALVTAYGITLPPRIALSKVALDILTQSNMRPALR